MHLPKFTNISEKNSRLAKENPGPKMPTQSHRTYRYIHELREALRHRCGNGFVVSTFVFLPVAPHTPNQFPFGATLKCSANGSKPKMNSKRRQKDHKKEKNNNDRKQQDKAQILCEILWFMHMRKEGSSLARTDTKHYYYYNY